MTASNQTNAQCSELFNQPLKCECVSYFFGGKMGRSDRVVADNDVSGLIESNGAEAEVAKLVK